MPEGLTYLETAYRQGEWGDEFFEDVILEEDGEEVIISFSPTPAVEREEMDEVAVLWAGALDFEGTREEALERYPDLKEWLNKEGD